MPISYLDIAGTYSGPGAYSYNVASWPGGAQLFVNSATGSDNPGRLSYPQGHAAGASNTQPRSAQGPMGDPNFPLKSVFGTAGALAYCLAGRGDTIIVAPGHTETLATGAVITIPAGVTIMGSGYGSSRPNFQFTVLGTFIQGGGAGIQLNNLIFDLTGVASLVKGFLVNTGGFQFVLCRLLTATTVNQATDGIVLNAGADDFEFVASEIDANAGVSARGISNPTGNTLNRPIVSGSYIHGQFSGSPVSFLTTTTQELLIEYNVIRQEHSATTFCIGIAAGNGISGMFANNAMYSSQASALSQAQFYSNTLGTGVTSVQCFATRGGASGTAGTAI